MGQVNFQLPEQTHTEAKKRAIDDGVKLEDKLPELVALGLKHEERCQGNSTQNNEDNEVTKSNE